MRATTVLLPTLLLQLLLPARTICQQDSIILPEPVTLDLDALIAEAVMNSPELQSASSQIDRLEARIPQEGGLADPEVRYMQEGIPGFRFREAMFSRLDLMQTLPFPGKLGTRADLAGIRAEHAGHDRAERLNSIIARLKSAYNELWLTQQTLFLDRENERLMKQFETIAQMRYGTGAVSQQEVLKAQIELASIGNEIVSVRQQELSAKAMMMSILNRERSDTLGYAVISEEVVFDGNLDSLLTVALHNRPMVMHDSLMIREGETMRRMAEQDYLPDFTVALERMTEPAGNFQGWSVSIGMTLPFSPWTLGKARARVEEAEAVIRQARTTYQSTRAMVAAGIQDLYFKVEAAKRQLHAFQSGILPQARQALRASLDGYRNGTTDFLMLIDAYRTQITLTKEYFMTRMRFEQNVAELEREVGVQNLTTMK